MDFSAGEMSGVFTLRLKTHLARLAVLSGWPLGRANREDQTCGNEERRSHLGPVRAFVRFAWPAPHFSQTLGHSTQCEHFSAESALRKGLG